MFVLIANLLTPLRASGPKTYHIQGTKCSGGSRGEARGCQTEDQRAENKTFWRPPPTPLPPLSEGLDEMVK